MKDKPVVFLHDRRIPGSRANIDHIAVGPRGATVIDSKNIKGKVKIDWRGGLFSPRTFDLYIGGRKRTNLVEKIEGQMSVVREVLDNAGFSHVEVHGAMCMADVDGLPFFGHPSLRGIAVDGTRHVAKLVAESGPLDVDTIKAVAAALERGLPPA